MSSLDGLLERSGVIQQMKSKVVQRLLDDMEKEIVYIVSYSRGSYEDHKEIIIFATTKKSKATKYVTKFNRILKKWQEYYKQYETNEVGISWLKEEHVQKYFDRWYELRQVNYCYWEQIELR